MYFILEAINYNYYSTSLNEQFGALGSFCVIGWDGIVFSTV